MARLTATQLRQLNNMNAAAQRGTLGTRIDALEFGSVASPSAGSVYSKGIVQYRTAPALGTAVYVHAAITMTSGTQTITTGITNPDYPRIVTIKGNASGNAGNVVITGTDINNAALTETIALNGASEVLGTKAFKTVTSIALPAETHAGTDTTSIGIGNKVGFPIAIPNTGLVLAKSFNLTVDAGTVTAGATADLSLYAPAGTFDGAKYLDLWFIA